MMNSDHSTTSIFHGFILKTGCMDNKNNKDQRDNMFSPLLALLRLTRQHQPYLSQIVTGATGTTPLS